MPAARSRADLRVVHIASGREWRGGQRQTWLLASELAKLAIPQTVVTRRGSELFRRLSRIGVHVHGCGWTLGLDPRALLAIVHEARRAPAVLHAHDPHAFTLAAAAARTSRRPLVVTRRAAFPLRRAGAWKQADRVIAISEAVRAQLLTDGVDPARIVVVRSAIDLGAVAGALPGGFRVSLALPEGSPLIATIAALTPEKGLDTLVAAAALLAEHTPKIHWAIAGAGPLAADLNRDAAGRGVGDTVHLLGHLDDPTSLLAEADCVVMPSRSEAFGSSLLDAMALGKPIVASGVGGIPEVLGPTGIVVPPGNPAALAAAVAAVTGDRKAAARLGAAAKERVQEFGADRMARAMVAVYRSVAQID